MTRAEKKNQYRDPLYTFDRCWIYHGISVDLDGRRDLQDQLRDLYQRLVLAKEPGI